jgi:hypothetical protein
MPVEKMRASLDCGLFVQIMNARAVAAEQPRIGRFGTTTTGTNGNAAITTAKISKSRNDFANRWLRSYAPCAYGKPWNPTT